MDLQLPSDPQALKAFLGLIADLAPHGIVPIESYDKNTWIFRLSEFNPRRAFVRCVLDYGQPLADGRVDYFYFDLYLGDRPYSVGDPNDRSIGDGGAMSHWTERVLWGRPNASPRPIAAEWPARNRRRMIEFLTTMARKKGRLLQPDL